MKKILLIISATFLFINHANAQDIENQLNEIQTNIISLKEEVSTLNENRLNKTFPIGSIYITAEYASENEVANAIGGQWETYTNGKILVGVDTEDTNFNTLNKTGGNITTTLTTSNLPSHTHIIPALSGVTNSAGAHYHNMLWGGEGANPVSITYREGTIKTMNLNSWERINATLETAHNFKTTTTGAHTHTVTTTANTSGSSGSGTAFTNLQPYITVYMYKRVG